MEGTNGDNKTSREWVLMGLSFLTLLLSLTSTGRGFARMIKNMFLNWKTTSAGVSLVVVGIVHIAFMFKNGTASEADVSATFISILGGIGLIAAGDAGASATKQAVQVVSDAVMTGDTTKLDKPKENQTETK